MLGNDFLPSTLADWISLVLKLLGVVSFVLVAVLKYVRAPLVADIAAVRKDVSDKAKEQGERIGKLEVGLERNMAKVLEVERDTEKLEMAMITVKATADKVDGHLMQLSQQIQAHHETRMEEARAMEGRLSSIETQLRLSRQDG